MADAVYPRFKTKKALKQAVKDGKEIYVERVSIHPQPFRNGEIVAIVGPSPYERKWYAAVKVNSLGIVEKVVK